LYLLVKLGLGVGSLNIKWLFLLLIAVVVLASGRLFEDYLAQSPTENLIGPLPPSKPKTAAVRSLITPSAFQDDHVTVAGGSYGAEQHSLRFNFDGAIAEASKLLAGVELTPENQARLLELQDQLTVISSMDKGARDHLANFIRDDPDSRLADFSLGILDQLARSDVVELGIELAQSSDRSAILKGLDILGQQSSGGVYLLQVTAPLLDQFRSDGEVLVEALHVISTASSDATTNGRVLMSLNELATHEDGSVRSASLFEISRRAHDGNELGIVIRSLQNDDPEDRISAAMALQQTKDTSKTLQDALLMRLTDQKELWEVRRIAADTLNRFSLSEEPASLLAQFRKEQENIVSVDSNLAEPTTHK
jgi:hypothetical protein